MAVDGAAIVVVSIAICTASRELLLMSVLVPVVIALRFVAWRSLPAQDRWAPLSRELSFFALCLGLGAFNDWSSVVRHQIYDYRVPHDFPELGSIPLWMLLYWGMILRFLATFVRWRRLPSAPLSERVRLPGGSIESARVKTGIELLLVVVTRQLVYRQYADPLLSWLPFALALVLFAALLGIDRRQRAIAGIVALGGPVVEIAYIQLGGLHRYHLGWLGGVPLWLVLWWALAILVWDDVAGRIQARMAGPAATAGRREREGGAAA